MSLRDGQGATLKALGVGFLGLLMLIPLLQVRLLIEEREGLEQESRATIASRWGGEQVVGGPVLVVPVRTQVQNDKGWSAVVVNHYLLPDTLRIGGSLATERRRYGIYETPVYTGDLEVSGHFETAALVALGSGGGEPLWADARLRVPVSDVRGIRRISAMRVAGREFAFGPGGDVGGMSATEVALPLADHEAERIAFAYDMRLAGTALMRFLPLARQTDVSLTAPWPDPGFTGAFLPTRHAIDEKGFEAQWQVLDLNRSFGQHWREGTISFGALDAAAFGVELYQPAGTYQRNERAGKYGILFVALTFVALFLFDALGRWRVHPVQYLLVGLALCTFYVVLLALSEQIGFGPSYAIAACAVIGIVAGYAAAASRRRSAGAALGALLAGVYVLLYGLVISEQYSLLMGAIALLAAVGLLMYLTRRVDWYALGPVVAPQPVPPPAPRAAMESA